MTGDAKSWVLARSGATGVTKERMDLMKDMADAMKAMGMIFKGEAPFTPATVAKEAGFLADHAMMIPNLTPPGSGDHPSEMLPIVWRAWDDYVQSACVVCGTGRDLWCLSRSFPEG